jgi:Rho family, other
MAEHVSVLIGARAYKECSAKKIEGVDDVFEAATRLSMLMREGVLTHGGSDSGETRHHRKRREDDDAPSCRGCVVC